LLPPLDVLFLFSRKIVKSRRTARRRSAYNKIKGAASAPNAAFLSPQRPQNPHNRRAFSPKTKKTF
jgi:hypothetical protein